MSPSGNVGAAGPRPDLDRFSAFAGGVFDLEGGEKCTGCGNISGGEPRGRGSAPSSESQRRSDRSRASERRKAKGRARQAERRRAATSHDAGDRDPRRRSRRLPRGDNFSRADAEMRQRAADAACELERDGVDLELLPTFPDS
ncbi:unnamed protein product, partial [Prorocentrum cordatum]